MTYEIKRNTVVTEFREIEIQMDAKIPIMQQTPDYNLSDLADIKDRFSCAKSLLDPYYLGSMKDRRLARQWYDFQGIIDTYKDMRKDIKIGFNPKNVTNAWMKYWEIYSHFQFAPTSAFFNAELPGAALSAFNHYMKSQHPDISFDWRASSLVPTLDDVGSTALDDSYGLWEMNKDKWLMNVGVGPAGSYRNNGDAMNIDNILDFARKVGPESEFGGVDLYSHDAGMDTTGGDPTNVDSFNQQEIINAKLHLGCALSGLLTLKRGGAFIAKQYTFFETFTWNLIIIYAQMFDKFYICKPNTSRPYNGEIYLVGKGFRGIPDDVKTALIERMKNFHTGPFIPAEAGHLITESKSKIVQFARQIFLTGAAILHENVELFEKYKHNLSTLRRGLEPAKRAAVDYWFKKFPMTRIDPRDELKTRKVK